MMRNYTNGLKDIYYNAVCRFCSAGLFTFIAKVFRNVCWNGYMLETIENFY